MRIFAHIFAHETFSCFSISISFRVGKRQRGDVLYNSSLVIQYRCSRTAVLGTVRSYFVGSHFDFFGATSLFIVVVMEEGNGLADMVVSSHRAAAFSRNSLGGNPAAVVLLASSVFPSERVMQSVAADFNLSETAFVAPVASHVDDSFFIRWFTPTNEVDLCGHATLAAAFVVFEKRNACSIPKVITFRTMHRGDLKVSRRNDGALSMTFPSNPVDPMDDAARRSFADRYSSVIQAVLRGIKAGAQCVESVHYSPGTKKMILQLYPKFAHELLNLSPDRDAMMRAHDGTVVRGVCVTVKGCEAALRATGLASAYEAQALEKVDFCSRYFSPWNGIDEDPVNGSSHTALAPFWTREVGSRHRELLAAQCSPRGGLLRVQFHPNADCVSIAGDACFIAPS